MSRPRSLTLALQFPLLTHHIVSATPGAMVAARPGVQVDNGNAFAINLGLIALRPTVTPTRW